ncbi:MAG: Sua5/YciO/YrdC/YwlC family protein [Pontibacterium sp.]
MMSWHVSQAVRAMRDGHVIAYPTEAVWGVGCDPYNEKALHKLLAIKSRPIEKGVILVAADVVQVQYLLDPLEPEEQTRLRDTWPGPNTWVIPDELNQVPTWIKGEHKSVAVRVSAHPLVRELCKAFGGPVVSTSANPAALAPARTALRVTQYFGNQVHLLPGQLGAERQPTKIRDLRSERVLRA